ncbi:sigma 28 [Moorella sp. E308F]|jgi:RNA polymerase sigma factor for flagellar operon FliA|uniref:sigma-70 family RNA polymerase sigma factor n=1 Tax=unclassified Neomoorella TaxID=2676739 RepID=UPI0010FFAE65|nr:MULTISPECIES: FliA/WhiG family RNA polymerase sigma factor [unclassified Moorella (in: firmicutes)]GEA16669.1 sigma 28 [Moorella sp. E308F]GEA17142.1 sigma 28 [Moorella sp. E306M]
MAVKDSAMWAAYLAGKGDAGRRELVLKYLPLVKYHVGRLAVKPPRHLDQEDLVGYGIIGLLEAIDRYDPSRGVNFESFASQRIRGAILDALRQSHWAPRTLVEKLRRVSQVYRRLEQEQGSEVSDAVVAAAAGITVDELKELLERGSQMAVLSLEDFLFDREGEEGSTRGELLADPQSPDPAGRYEQEELRRALIEGLQHLNDKDRLVLTLYYYEGLTLKEIGKILGVSESRVCQLHGRAILNLRRYLADFM